MEKDLFLPIKVYFEEHGYVCDGEVEDIDLYMEKEGESVAVELKQTLDFKAVQQAALRQKVTDYVYVGIFKPKDLYTGAFRDKIYLLKRLGIGLIVVSKKTKSVEVISAPVVSELSAFQKRNTGKRKKISEEFKKRKTKSNTGGVRGTKLITSYREDALLVLDALMELGGEGSTKQIREISGVRNTTDILYRNYYGWFQNVQKGIYRVHEEGYRALEEYEETLCQLHKNKP